MNTTQPQPTALPKHTPTPWRIDNRAEGVTASIFGSDGKTVASCFYKSYEQSYANAAHIVHCVNSQPALMAENKRLREALELITKSNTFAGGPYKGELERIARAALAKEDV